MAALAFLCILAPFGAIFGAHGSSCCSSMKSGTCPMQRRTHDACKSSLAHCRTGANENAGQAVVDFQLIALQRPLIESSGFSLSPPSSATDLTAGFLMAPRSLTFPPELRPPREQRAL